MTPVGWDEKVGRVIVVFYFDHFTMESIGMNPAPIGMYKTLGLWCPSFSSSLYICDQESIFT